MVAPLTNTTQAAAGVDTSSALASFTSQSGSLGKDDFLKLLIAQMQHQDPLKPMDDTAFVAQLAQFSSLEQQANTNKLLELVAQQQQGLANNTIVDMVGKNVTVKGDKVTYDGQGFGAPVRFTLAAPADSVKISIVDAGGNTIRTMNVGAKPAGPISALWDGKSDLGIQQPAGAYSVQVKAKGPGGTSVEVLQETTGTVTSVSFDQGFTNLILDNGVNAPASDLIKVNK
jgi:flagellar basal-body rod modification protein FlgD